MNSSNMQQSHPPYSSEQQFVNNIPLHDYSGNQEEQLQISHNQSISNISNSNQNLVSPAFSNDNIVHKLYSRIVGNLVYPQDATSSYLIPPHYLRFLRIVGALYLTIVILISLYRDITYSVSFVEFIKHFFFFTNLNLYGLIAYFYFTLYITHRTFRKGVDSDEIISERAQIIHSIMYSVNCTFHPIVVIVFWLFLSDIFINSNSTLGRLVSVSAHGVTLIFVLCEVIFSAMIINIWSIVPTLIILVLYTIWALIYYFISNVFVYNFLDFHKPQASYMYPGVAIACILSFFMMFGLNKLRFMLLRNRSLKSPPTVASLVRPDNVV